MEYTSDASRNPIGWLTHSLNGSKRSRIPFNGNGALPAAASFETGITWKRYRRSVYLVFSARFIEVAL